ncbi:MAG: acyl-CoA dehydratase activase [Clostridiales Family XIII bacterium]|jgi:predicted CoA-substrate-specific enzyme activase|nr:acyl-CoA dehydratase activase [Clostridiales Family XIII bacterium]
MFLGIDIGSSSSKAVLLDKGGAILGREVVNLGTGSGAIDDVIDVLLEKAGVDRGDILYSVVTGYGRIGYEKADTQITEIGCHAKGVYHDFPEARSIIDIGGQDAKVIRLGDGGRVDNFVMNEKCAAGTGRFFEVMARVLNCSLDDLSGLAAEAEYAVAISSTCTVFAESEVISQLSAGASPASVAWGAHKSVAKRIAGLSGRLGLIPEIVMTGGVALNQSMVRAMEEEIETSILVPESPQTVGALGAAVYAKEKYESASRDQSLQ